MSKSNQFKVLASLWLVFIGTAFVMSESQQLVSDYHLVKHSVTTQGYVVEKLPNEHQAVRYRYTVDGVEYEGIDAAAHKFHFVKLGDKIDVIFDQQEPAYSMLSNPQLALYHDCLGVVFLVVGSAIGFGIFAWVRLGSKSPYAR